MRYAAATAAGIALTLLAHATWRTLLGWALSRGDHHVPVR